jgi:hypothetical protein
MRNCSCVITSWASATIDVTGIFSIKSIAFGALTGTWFEPSEHEMRFVRYAHLNLHD